MPFNFINLLDDSAFYCYKKKVLPHNHILASGLTFLTHKTFYLFSLKMRVKTDNSLKEDPYNCLSTCHYLNSECMSFFNKPILFFI